MKSIFIEPKEIQEVDFGYIKLTLKEFLDKNHYTRNQLSVHTGIKYTTIDRYYKSNQLDRIDLTLLSKICYVLNCKLTDIIEYIPPVKMEWNQKRRK